MTVPERHEGQNQVLVDWGVFEVVLEMVVELLFDPVKALGNVMEVIGAELPEPEKHGKHESA